MADSENFLSHSDPVIRHTYRAHLWMYLLAAPAMALIRYSPFLADKRFDARMWVPVLAAIIPASHLIAVFFTRAIERSDKTSWVVRPMILSNIFFFLMIFVDKNAAWMFGIIIILAQSMRAPIISAQAAIFRVNYPADRRSYALSIPMALQFMAIALYSRLGGSLFDLSEKWVNPVFIGAAVLGIWGALVFGKVKIRENGFGENGGQGAGESEGDEPKPSGKTADAMPGKTAGQMPGQMTSQTSASRGLLGQFKVLFENKDFLQYELAFFFFGSGFVAIMATFAPYLNEEFSPSYSQAAMAMNTIPMLAVAVTLPIWGKLLDRYNPLAMRAIINGVWTLTPLLLYFAPSIEMVYVAQLIQGLVFSGSMLIWWLGVNYFARNHEVASFMAIHQTLTGIRGIITPFVGFAIAQKFGYRESMLLWFGLMFIGFLIMVSEVWREMKKGKLKTFSESEAHLEATQGLPSER